jgi:hypothetical protein
MLYIVPDIIIDRRKLTFGCGLSSIGAEYHTNIHILVSTTPRKMVYVNVKIAAYHVCRKSVHGIKLFVDTLIHT